MSSSWHLLSQQPPSTQLPPLLISTIFTTNSYTIYLTDLTYIWSESLNRRAIIKRSLDEDTSIDPSEDAEQLRVFLDKIQSALSGGEKTTLSLSAHPSSNSNGPTNLDLHITAVLPKPLRPLQWPFHLAPLPQFALTAQLTVPLLRRQNTSVRELDALVEILREKDHVIQKLVDKLEATGAELGHVFLGAAGKGGRKIPRKLAEERVKGLGVFEVEGWKKEIREMEKDNDSEDIGVVLKEGFEAHNGPTLIRSMDSEVSCRWGKWWEDLKTRPIELWTGIATATAKVHNEDAEVPSAKSLNNPAAQDSGDDFRVQATPPHLRGSSSKDGETASSPPTLESQAAIRDSTDDEDDLDGPSQRSAVPDSFPISPSKPQPRQPGTISHLKPAPKQPAKSKSPVPAANPREDHTFDDGEETATDDEDDHPPTKAPAPEKRTASPPAEKTKKGTLGKIGGMHTEATPPLLPPPSEETALPERKPKHKLGAIGHKTAAAPEAVKENDEREVWAEEKTEEEVQRRETSKEKADRKREELKRLLEEKAKAPVKKKRKF